MTMLTVEAANPYKVYIGQGALNAFDESYRELLADADKIAIIADAQVAALHLDHLKASLNLADKLAVKEIPAGEQSKSMETFMECQSFLLENDFSRKSLLLAFGGGATGDLVGFVASTFMRGISYIQIPTTILAHDSAVGGKTAINHALGKNMIGTFHQPAAVIYDTYFLETLPDKEIRSGMAEVIKHAFISNENWLLELLAVKNLQEMSKEQLAVNLERGIAVKAAIVEEDEFESGVRKFLNFGHTLAHAIEALSGYGKITHGEAVAIGMAYALELSGHRKLPEFLEWCLFNGYPLGLLENFSFEKLAGIMKKDKKSSGGLLNFVLLKETGRPFMATIDEKEAEKAYDALRSKIGEMHI
ncbi:3-dehydroquinate synthase [Planomicrobium sp. Y74]|uniref:3-dehydroquinate synthase n=1 Tax=Planomicrobium sp. Y74 TaxID=2478977 RepID=UPI000EF54605|nr:3-dehydroquinate synthase [Planomicrobium sp. Y74]RLQ92564.1 3-dehydroquinate synthase [Planomicrobium sp. Y74]